MRMRVALVSLARRGGMVHFLAEIANGLARIAEVSVVVSTEAELQNLKAGIIRAPVNTGNGEVESAARFFWPVTWIRVSSLLKSLNADVVHIVGAHEWNPLVAAVCVLRRTPLIYTVHDPEPHPGSSWRMRLGDRLTARLADQLVALTKLGRRQLLNRGAASGRVAVISHPIYTYFRRWRPSTRRAEKIILYFGRLEAYKGLELLLRAFQAARPALPGWRLIVAGNGQIPPGLRRSSWADTQLTNRYLSDREVAHLMNRCSIVALPYTSATQSGVVALALAFARPVIATAVGGLTEMVIHGKTGILVRPTDPKAFSRALRNLAMDSAGRARMRREIVKMANANWGPRVVASELLRLYALAVKTRRSK